MATLAVEQKQQQYGYQRDEVTQGGPNQVNLGGFAISFEDLLQRVGARLENAFSAADKTSGIPVSAANSDDSKNTRDQIASRDDKSDRSDDRKDDAPADKTRKASSDKRDNTADRSDDKPRTDVTADNRAEQADNNGRDDVNPENKTEKADSGRHDDKAGKEKSADSSDGDAKSQSTEQTAESGKTDASKQTGEQHATVAEAPHVAQAAAIYAAGLIGKSGNENVKSNTGDAMQQAQKGVDVVQNTPAQLAAAMNQKGQQATHNNTAGKAAGQNTDAKGGEQKAAASEQKGVTPAMQAQAQQLSKAIGGDNRININVNVRNDQNQLTMKTSLTDSSTLVLAQDSAKSSQPATANQPAQQQGPNTQQIQQAQLAASQQTQASQQANVQNGPQGAATANSAAGTQQIGALQSGTGNAQHAGGNEALNNTTQSAGAAQQSQQTQQTREAAPQQQAQHLQRSTLPGSVTEQISIKISKALEAGTDKISIQLRPAELGRVDVKMEMTHDGRIMTVVSAEKQDTLDLLKRDSSELQRALADAGLQSGDMQFNLKGQERQSAEADGNDKNGAAGKLAEAEIEDNTDGPIMTAWESGIFANGRLDMRA